MKNVLLVGESYSGGVKTYIDTIMRSQDQVSHIHFQALVSSKRLENGEEIDGDYLLEDNLSFGKSPLKLFVALKTLDRVVKEKNINVIHVNSTFAGVVMYLYSFWNHKVFYIYTPHGYFSFKNMAKTKKAAVRFIEKRINNASNLIIHVSPSEEKEAIENKLTTAKKSLVVLNGSTDPEVKFQWKKKDVFTIVNLARVDDPKNPFEFIEIAQKILETNLNVQFIWAGNGRYLEQSREKVRACGQEDKIKFVGFSTAKGKILEQSDLYFSTSQYEGLPFGVVEAMSYKLPLLLTDIIGHKDLIEGNDNGLLFKSKEDYAIYDFVQNLIHNQEKWESLSAASYRIFNERFNTKQMLKKLVNVYQNV